MIRNSELLISILETRDPNLYGHSLHTEKLSLLLYDALPFSEGLKIRRDDLLFAALYHDIGPESIIQKAGKLTAQERKEMQRHPEISVELFKQFSNNKRILEGIRYHHERPDGKGYYGLKGDEIPLISRFLI